MDEDKVDEEFESLLIYNRIEYSGERGPAEESAGPCMSLVELSSIAQDLNSMLWFLQDVMTRVYEEKSVTIDAEVIEVLRKMQEDSYKVIEGLVFDDNDDDDDDDESY